jgi:hypothetical protein
LSFELVLDSIDTINSTDATNASNAITQLPNYFALIIDPKDPIKQNNDILAMFI